MGVNNLTTHIKLTSKGFLDAQGHWGHKKERLNHSSNIHVLGFKNDFTIINPEHFLEYSKRCNIFCSKTILNGGNIFFINSNDEYKKLIIYFGSRSLQPIHYNKWFGGLLTNNFFKNPCVFVMSNVSKNSFILKEASKKLIPVISIEDSDYSFNKAFYSVLGNDDSKQSLSFFYSNLTNHIIKSLLYNHCKSLYKNK
jgi:ribosomal protein S2